MTKKEDMKNRFIVWTMFLVFFMGISSCSDNENWKIVTDVQPGVYAGGTATVYLSEAPPAASFKPAALDPADDTKQGIYSMYTWLKASGDLSIIKVANDGTKALWGKGEAVAGHALTTTLVADAPSFKVAKDGLYLLIYNSTLNQLTIIPANFGIIGDATPEGWGGETLLPTIEYKESNYTVEFRGKFPLTKNQMKFRFNGDWTIQIPYDASSTIKVHTNVGSTANGDGDTKLTAGSTSVVAGGKNLAVEEGAAYDITLKFELGSGTFSTSAIKGEIIAPTYPEKLYMIGTDFGNWIWDASGVVELVPVNGVEGAFWCINYFNANTGFKWAPGKAWDGSFSELKEAIGYTIVDGNANLATSGLYVVYIDMKADKIAVEPAMIHGIGDAFGNWDSGKNPFTVTGDKATITVSADGDLRMYVGSSIATSDWWSREFNIYDGKIIYRGTGGDQAAVSVKAGNTVTLDFKAGNGSIN
ncbi:MAG: hypothetical protein RL662_505 [Bacteroidota bacterium]|jgi:hypothetical protein